MQRKFKVLMIPVDVFDASVKLFVMNPLASSKVFVDSTKYFEEFLIISKRLFEILFKLKFHWVIL